MREPRPDGSINPPYKYNPSPELADLLSRMLVQDPNYRLSLEEILKHPWVVKDRGLYEKCLNRAPAGTASARSRSAERTESVPNGKRASDPAIKPPAASAANHVAAATHADAAPPAIPRLQLNGTAAADNEMPPPQAMPSSQQSDNHSHKLSEAAAPPMRSPRTVVTPRGRIEVSARGSTTPRQNASQVVISPRTAIRVEETKSVLTSSTNRPSGGYGTSRSSSASRSGSAGVLQTSSPPNSARGVNTAHPVTVPSRPAAVYGMTQTQTYTSPYSHGGSTYSTASGLKYYSNTISPSLVQYPQYQAGTVIHRPAETVAPSPRYYGSLPSGSTYTASSYLMSTEGHSHTMVSPRSSFPYMEEATTYTTPRQHFSHSYYM